MDLREVELLPNKAKLDTKGEIYKKFKVDGTIELPQSLVPSDGVFIAFYRHCNKEFHVRLNLGEDLELESQKQQPSSFGKHDTVNLVSDDDDCIILTPPYSENSKKPEKVVNISNTGKIVQNKSIESTLTIEKSVFKLRYADLPSTTLDIDKVGEKSKAIEPSVTRMELVRKRKIENSNGCAGNAEKKTKAIDSFSKEEPLTKREDENGTVSESRSFSNSPISRRLAPPPSEDEDDSASSSFSDDQSSSDVSDELSSEDEDFPQPSTSKSAYDSQSSKSRSISSSRLNGSKPKGRRPKFRERKEFRDAYAVISSGMSRSESEEKLKTWLQTHERPFKKVKTYMHLTYDARRKDSIDHREPSFFDMWPRFFEYEEMYDYDFYRLHPNAGKFKSSWPNLVDKVIRVVGGIKHIGHKLGIYKKKMSAVDRSVAALLMLPYYIKSVKDPSAEAPLSVYSSSEARDKFFSVIPADEVPSHMMHRSDIKLSRDAISYDPIIVVAGDITQLNFIKYYVMLFNRVITCENVAEAVDLCFKCYKLFDLPFPPEVDQIWKFFGYVVYNIVEVSELTPSTRKFFDDCFF